MFSVAFPVVQEQMLQQKIYLYLKGEKEKATDEKGKKKKTKGLMIN